MNNFKEYRLRENLNQVQLAERLNVTQACISRWEHGNSYPEIDTAKKISEILHISLDMIYDNPHTFGAVEIPIFQSISYSGSTRICTKPGCFLQMTPQEMRMLYPRSLISDGASYQEDPKQFFGYYYDSTNMTPQVLPDSISIIFKTDKIFPNAIHLVNIEGDDSILVRLTPNNQNVWALLDSSSMESRYFRPSEIREGALRIIGVMVQNRRHVLL